MQYGRVLNLRGYRKVIGILKQNGILIISALFFAIGLCIGVFSFNKYPQSVTWTKNYISDFIVLRTGSSFLKVFVDSFFSSMLFLVFCFMSGTCMLGVLLTPLCLSVKGYLYGTVTAFLYSTYSLKGIAFHTVLIMPSAIVLVVALVLAAVESSRFSVVILRLSLPNTMPMNLSAEFKRLTFKYFVFTTIVMLSALVDALITCNFIAGFGL